MSFFLRWEELTVFSKCLSWIWGVTSGRGKEKGGKERGMKRRQSEGKHTTKINFWLQLCTHTRIHADTHRQCSQVTAFRYVIIISPTRHNRHSWNKPSTNLVEGRAYANRIQRHTQFVCRSKIWSPQTRPAGCGSAIWTLHTPQLGNIASYSGRLKWTCRQCVYSETALYLSQKDVTGYDFTLFALVTVYLTRRPWYINLTRRSKDFMNSKK